MKCDCTRIAEKTGIQRYILRLLIIRDNEKDEERKGEQSLRGFPRVNVSDNSIFLCNYYFGRENIIFHHRARVEEYFLLLTSYEFCTIVNVHSLLIFLLGTFRIVSFVIFFISFSFLFLELSLFLYDYLMLKLFLNYSASTHAPWATAFTRTGNLIELATLATWLRSCDWIELD